VSNRLSQPWQNQITHFDLLTYAPTVFNTVPEKSGIGVDKGAIPPRCPKIIFSQKNAQNLFIFLPRTLLGRLAGVKSAPKRKAVLKQILGYG